MSSVLEIILNKPVEIGGKGRSQQFPPQFHSDPSLCRPGGMWDRVLLRWTLQISKGTIGSQNSRGQVAALIHLFLSQ